VSHTLPLIRERIMNCWKYKAYTGFNT
jgi:hypothetical protein